MRLVVHNYFGQDGSGAFMGPEKRAHEVRRDASVNPELEARARSRLDELRNRYQTLHYQRLDYEKRARELKRKNDPQEAFAWETASRVAMEEHLAEDRYKAFQREMRAMGLKP